MPVARIWTTEEEACLKVMWADRNITVTSMGKKLSIDPQTIRNHATRLALSPRKSMSWPQRDIDTLRRLHAKGYTRAAVARQMVGYSRSAVIGKLDRLGLCRNGRQPAGDGNISAGSNGQNRAITLVSGCMSQKRFTFKREYPQ